MEWGFLIERAEAESLGFGKDSSLNAVLRLYRNGRDLADRPRDVLIIDFFGLSAEQARQSFPKLYEIVLSRVKPERDAKGETKDGAGYARLWWLHGKPRSDMRRALVGLPRYIATVKTARRRCFQFLDSSILPDSKLIIFALSDAFFLGVLNSKIHQLYSLASGGWLGVGNDPTYSKSRSFDPFPFPDCPEAQKAKIRALAEALDAHRKRAQADHALGLTDIYNVLERVRSLGTPSSSSASVAPLTPKEKVIHDQALVSTLRQLHDELDAAVAAAYGWPWPLADADILTRVVALNAQRAAEEASGQIRYLRPEYQKPAAGGRKPEQSSLALPSDPPSDIRPPSSSTRRSAKPTKQPWPSSLAERTKALDAILATDTQPLTTAEITKRFARAKEEDVQEILETLAALGRLRRTADDERWGR
jgi:hypothetical protein